MRMALINPTKGAKLITDETGRSCSRQNLEKHCRRGRLPISLVSINPIRVNSETLVAEFLAAVNEYQTEDSPSAPQRQSERVMQPQQRGASVHMPDSTDLLPPGILLDDGTYNINQAKAWAELERARKLQVERLATEGKYMEVEKVAPAWERAMGAINRGVMGIGSRLKADRPELPLDVIDLVEALCREALEKASMEIAE